MSIVFAARGNSLNARFAPGGAHGAVFGAVPAVSSSAQSGIGGSNTWDFSGAASARRPLVFPGGLNLPLATPNHMTVLMRVYFDSVSTDENALFKLGFGGRVPIFGHEMFLTNANQIRAYYYDTDDTNDAVFSSTSLFTLSTWHDLVWQYPATALTNGNKIYLDAVQDKQQNSVKTVKSYAEGAFGAAAKVMIGYNSDANGETRCHIDEVVIWDTLINPASVGLTSGTGSLNGASRTAYVDVGVQDGTPSGGGASSLSLGGFGI